MAVFEVETEEQIFDVEAENEAEARKIVLDSLSKEPEKDKRSLFGRAADLYSATKGAVRGGIRAGVKEAQKTPVKDFFAIKPGFVDIPDRVSGAIAKGAKEGFDLENEISGSDILEDIPELKTNAVFKFPLSFPFGSIPPRIEAQEQVFEVETQDNVFDVQAENEEQARQIVLENIGSTDDRDEQFDKTFQRDADLVDKGISILNSFGPGDISKGVFNTLNAMRKMKPEISIKPEIIVNLPKKTSEFSLDVVTDPLTPILAGVSGAIGQATKLPFVAKGLSTLVKIIKSLPGAQYFQRGGGDTKFIKILDDVDNNINVMNRKSIEVAEDIAKNFNLAEDKRIAQIVRGSVSSDPKLRGAAERVKEIQDGLEQEAKRLNFLKDTFRTKLTRKQLATLRKEKDLIEKSIVKLDRVPHKARLQKMANAIHIKGDAPLANALRGMADKFSLKGFETRKRFQVVMDAIDHSKTMQTRTKGKMLNLLNKAENTVGEQRFKLTEQIFDILDDEVQGLGVVGLKPLVKEIGLLSRKFPGKAKKIRELEGKSQDITNRIVQHYTEGGKGYLPRLYSIFESGYGKEMAKKGVNFDDLLELGGDQLSAIQSLTPSEFNAFLKKIGKAVPSVGSRVRKIGGERFLKRQAISDEMRKALGEIDTVSYPFAKGATQVAKDIEHKKFFQLVSENKNWALTKEEFKESVKQGFRGSFRLMPEAENLGALSGKMVKDNVAREVLHVTKTSGPMMKAWNKALGHWKFGKVILNPATHFRNIMSNSILLDLSGEDMLKQMYLIPKAAKELINKGKYYDEFKNTSLAHSGYVEGELKAFLNPFIRTRGDVHMRFANVAKDVTTKLGDVYQSEESLFKMAKFIAERERGKSIQQAVGEAEKWLFNYSKLAPATRAIKQFPVGSPFITFTAKALPRIAEAAIKNPARMYKYRAIFNAIEENSREKLGIAKDEMRWIKKTFKGTGLVLPAKDAEGLPYVLDLSYILPWGDIGEEGGVLGLPPVFTPSGPLVSIGQALIDKSFYTGKPIRKPLESWWIKTADTVDFVYKALTPSFAPGLDIRESPVRGGYSFNKLMSAIKKKPDWAGRIKSLSWTIADVVFGLKAYPTSPQEKLFFEALNTNKLIRERIQNSNRILRHKGISEEEKVREKKRLGNDLNRAFMRMKDIRGR